MISQRGEGGGQEEKAKAGSVFQPPATFGVQSTRVDGWVVARSETKVISVPRSPRPFSTVTSFSFLFEMNQPGPLRENGRSGRTFRALRSPSCPPTPFGNFGLCPQLRSLSALPAVEKRFRVFHRFIATWGRLNMLRRGLSDASEVLRRYLQDSYWSRRRTLTEAHHPAVPVHAEHAYMPYR